MFYLLLSVGWVEEANNYNFLMSIKLLIMISDLRRFLIPRNDNLKIKNLIYNTSKMKLVGYGVDKY